MHNYLLALDQGTTSSRALLLDRAGQIVAVSRLEFRQIFPQPGWVEHDPTEIWSSQIGVAAEVVSRSGARLNEIAAVGITNQRETAIVWERKTGNPVYNGVVWQDRRTAGICDKMKADGLESVIEQKTGLVIDAYFVTAHPLLKNPA
jgi:glycerol kinase